MNTETFPQETIDLMRRTEHALWMSRLAQRIHDKKTSPTRSSPNAFTARYPKTAKRKRC